MSASIPIPSGTSKAEKYSALLPQIEALIGGEEDLIANLANISAVLKEAFGFFWSGFYLVKGVELVLGPFQGPLACTRIGYGKGVCGTSWKEGRTILVPNVEEFPGHIACNTGSRSEIVIPGFKDETVAIILDIDSDRFNAFDKTDQQYLERLMRMIERML